MGFFKSLGNLISAPFKVVTKPIEAGLGLLSGGSSGGTATQYTNTSTKLSPVTNVTNKIDTEPLAKILAQSNKDTNRAILQSAKITEDAQKLSLINAERQRQLETAKLKQFDTYMEHAKNGLILSGVAAGLLYVYKKGK